MFQLDLKSRKSIYEQVMDNFKEYIMTGKLASGEKLPSVRELSKTITVNPNTVQKAYRELERQVSDKSKILPDPKAVTEAKDNLDDAFCQLLYLGMSHDEAKEIALDIIERRRISND